MSEQFLAPHSVEAEQAVLGAILIDPDSLNDVLSFLSPDDFFILRNNWTFEAMLRLHERGDAIDNLTVIEELRIQKHLEEVTAAYITYLINNTPTSLHTEVYGRFVERCAIRRRILEAAGNIVVLANNEDSDIDDVINHSEIELRMATDRRTKSRRKSITQSEAIEEYRNEVEQIADGEYNPKIFTSGITNLDDNLRIEAGNVCTILGDAGVGKTTALMHYAMEAAAAGLHVLYITGEMACKELIARQVAVKSGITYFHQKDKDKLCSPVVFKDGTTQLDRRGNPVTRLHRITKTIGELGNLPMRYSYEMNVDRLCSDIRALDQEWGLDLVIFDYAQLGEVEDKRNKVEDLNAIWRKFKLLALELRDTPTSPLRVAFMIGSQTNSDGTAFYSRAAHQHSDQIVRFERVEKQNESDPDVRLFRILKQRNGPSGNEVCIQVQIKPHILRLENILEQEIDV